MRRTPHLLRLRARMSPVLTSLVILALASACTSSDMYMASGADGSANSRGGPYESMPCAAVECQPGFHCEFDACVADTVPGPVAGGGEARDPLASERYVFALEAEARRVVRIDSATLQVKAFPAGLAPIDLAVVGGRELTVLLDALNVVEVFDHRQEPPTVAAWPTARSLSHLAVSPTGLHAIAYFDWDDARAQRRQSEPGNINQVTVLYLGDASTPFADTDPRAVNLAVGFLPRAVRFSRDGSRAIVIGRGSMSVIVLESDPQLDGNDGARSIASPIATVAFDDTALEIVINSTAASALLRFADSAVVQVLDLSNPTAAHRCFDAPATVTDIAFTTSSEILIDVDGTELVTVDMNLASAPCAVLPAGVAIADAPRIAVDPSGPYVVAYDPAIETEIVWVLDRDYGEATPIALEKAVAAVAFVGDGEHALFSHIKAPGDPIWDLTVEDPAVSVDKSYGVTWINLQTRDHRLAINGHPFGPFAFVPAQQGESPFGATYQTLLDDRDPVLLRVEHAAGFNDRWLELAALPERIGYLPGTRHAWVTQTHPWGRVTFLDPAGTTLRHVTGFAMEAQ